MKLVYIALIVSTVTNIIQCIVILYISRGNKK